MSKILPLDKAVRDSGQRNFVFVESGSTGGLVICKQAIATEEIDQAKEDAGGSGPITKGRCQVKADGLLFEVTKASDAFKARLIKTLKDKVHYRHTVEFKVAGDEAAEKEAPDGGFQKKREEVESQLKELAQDNGPLARKLAAAIKLAAARQVQEALGELDLIQRACIAGAKPAAADAAAEKTPAPTPAETSRKMTARRRFADAQAKFAACQAKYGAWPFVPVAEFTEPAARISAEFAKAASAADMAKQAKLLEQLVKVFKKRAKALPKDQRKTWAKVDKKHAACGKLVGKIESRYRKSPHLRRKLALEDRRVRAEAAPGGAGIKDSLEKSLRRHEVFHKLLKDLRVVHERVRNLQEYPFCNATERDAGTKSIQTVEKALLKADTVEKIEAERRDLQSLGKSLDALEKKYTAELAAWHDYRGALKDARDGLAAARGGKYANAAKLADAIQTETKNAAQAFEEGKGGVAVLQGSAARLRETDVLKDAAVRGDMVGRKQVRRDRKAREACRRQINALKVWQERIQDWRGVGAQCEILEKKIAGVQGLLVTDAEGRQHGFHAALKFLQEPPTPQTIRQQAEEARANYKPVINPPLAEPAAKGVRSLEELARVASRADVAGYQNDFNRLEERAAASKSNDASAALLKEIAAWQAALDAEIAAQKALRDECRQKLAVIQAKLAEQADQVAPAALAQINLALEAAFEHFKEKENGLALDLLDGAAADVQKLAVNDQAVLAWRQEAGKVPDLKARCHSLMSWPPVSQRALGARDRLAELEASLESGANLQDACATLREIETLVAQLETEVQVAFSGADDPAAALKRFDQLLTRAQEKVRDKDNTAVLLLAKLEEAMGDDVKQRDGTPLHARHRAAQRDWTAFLRDPLKAFPQAAPEEALLAGTKKALADFETIAEEAERLAKPEGQAELQELVRKATAKDRQARVRTRPQRIEELLGQCQLAGIDVTAYRRAFVQATADATPARDRQLVELEGQLEAALAGHGKDVLPDQLKARALQATVKVKLKKVGLSHPHFKPFLENLNREIEDAEALIQSGDPALIAQAQVDLKRIQEDADTAVKKGANAFEAVENAWKVLANQLNNENVKKHRRVAQTRLQAELELAIVAAKAQQPEEAVASLQEMEAPIQEVYLQAQDDHRQYEAFEGRCAAIRKQFAALRKKTKTRMTDKPSAYTDRLTRRLEQANAAALNEGGLGKAFLLVDAIDRELEGFFQAADPRAALLNANAEVEKEVRTIKELVRNWEESYKHFVAERQRAEIAVNNAGSNADGTQITQLNKAGARVAKDVRKYRVQFSAAPDDFASRLRAKGAPLLVQVEADFAIANQQLEDLRQTARRIAANPAGTRIQADRSLAKVEREWKRAATNYAAAVRKLAEEIRKDGADDPAPEVKEAVQKALPKLQAVARRFAADVFAEPIGALTGAEDAVVRKAAREEGLRLVTRFLADVRKRPVIRIIASQDNPFHTVHVQTAMLITALKSLRITLLSAG